MGDYAEIKSSGITDKTPGNILLGAGTIHKGLKYDAQKKAWNFAESLIGATSGGNKFSIKPEIKQIEVDGAWVPVKQFDIKQGGTAEMEINLIELSPDILQLYTVKLILQPLVENAIYYGIKESETPGLIAISGRRSGSVLELRVTDNGPGIPPERLAELQKEKLF